MTRNGAMDFSARAAAKDAARSRRRRSCTPPRPSSTLPVTPWKFSVEGDAAAVHGGLQAEDHPGGRRLQDAGRGVDLDTIFEARSIGQF